MSKFVKPNPITHRLEKLRTEWNKATEKPHCRIIRWHVQQDEQRMVQGFLELECSEHGQSPDIFIRFESAFEKDRNYCAALIHELITRFREDKETREALEADGLSVAWNPAWDDSSVNKNLSYSEFNSYLCSFTESLPGFQGKLVLYLTPERTDDEEAFEQWIMDATEEGIPASLLITVVDCTLYNWFSRLATDYPQRVVSLRPDLKMYEALKQMATGGNAQDPDVQFRNHFLKMSEAAAQKKSSEMEEHARKAIDITVKYKWDHLKALVYIAMGGSYLQFGKNEDALKCYDQALEISLLMHEKGKAEAGPMVIQSHTCKGALMEIQNKYILAAESYAEAGRFASETGDLFKAMEGYRLAGKAAEESNKAQAAMTYYKLSLENGKQLSEEIRYQSTFVLLAESMSALAQKLYQYQPEELKELEAGLRTWAGEDWKKKASEIKTETRYAGLQTI